MKDFWVTYEECICVRAEDEEDARAKVLEWNEDYFVGASDNIEIIKVEEGDEW